VLQLEDGVQPLEAMLYTLQLINNDPDLLPGIKLGMIAYDSCDSPAYALEQTLDVIKGMTPATGIEHLIATLRKISL
jgi:metabotropic X receptor